jgi:hypothetical protein
MKKEEIDTYLNKYVEVVPAIKYSCAIYKGILYKIDNFKFNVAGSTRTAIINKGYVLDRGDRWINMRKSHIKKINLIKE